MTTKSERERTAMDDAHPRTAGRSDADPGSRRQGGRRGGIAVFSLDRGIPECQAYGPALATTMSARLRRGIETPDHGVIPPGPHFTYQGGPELFLGRSGDGPLDVVWDTNVLIDYFDHGNALWEGVALPDVIAAKYGEELEALQLIAALWVIRDIRFHVSPRVVHDAKRKLSAENRANRQRALIEFANALSLVSDGEQASDDPSAAVQLVLPDIADPRLDGALAMLPVGFDRILVEEALHSGAHVFLTRDDGVLKCRAAFAPLRLCIASPQDLLEELSACGALHCLIAPQYAYWPIPDLQRVSHIIAALPPRIDDDG